MLTQFKELTPVAGTTGSGHLEALPRARLNAGYQFSNPTFAGSAATDGNAPIAELEFGEIP